MHVERLRKTELALSCRGWAAANAASNPLSAPGVVLTLTSLSAIDAFLPFKYTFAHAIYGFDVEVQSYEYCHVFK